MKTPNRRKAKNPPAVLIYGIESAEQRAHAAFAVIADALFDFLFRALEIIRKALYAQKILRAAVDELAVNGDVVIVERCAAGAAGFIVCHYFSFTGFAMNTMVSCGSTCAT